MDLKLNTDSDKKKKEPKKKSITVKKTLVIKALEKNLGNISKACKKVDISRQCFYRWKEEDPKFAERVEDINELIIDFAESHLFKQIKNNIPSSTIFFLKTKGRDRGYIEKNETDITTNGKDINQDHKHIVTFVNYSKEDD